MAKKHNVDIDLDNIARVTNSLEPLADGDAVPRSFVHGQNIEALAETSTTSTTVDSVKATLEATNLPSGNYVLEWSFKWRAAAANRAMRVNVKDGASELLNHIEFIPNTAAQPMVIGRKKLTGISGNKTFTLNFRVSGSETTVFMSEALLSIRRIM